MKKEREQVIIEDSDLDGFREYLYERENSEATIQKYLTDLRTFYQFLNGKKKIDKQHLIAYKEWLVENYAVSSVNSMIAALNQFLIYVEAGKLRIRRIKVQKQLFASQEKELSREEYKRLLNAARDLGKPVLALIIETICSTGIRISELPFFKAENIKCGRICVYNKGKMRVILIPEALRKKLLFFIQKQGITEGCIFRTRTGKPKDRSNIWAQMKALHKEAGVDAMKVFPHNLRHLFARIYYVTTKDFAGLADLLGHSSLEVTRIYTSTASQTYQKRLEGLGLVS